MPVITIELGSAPPQEPVAQSTWDNFSEVNTTECRVYRDYLLRTLGPEPNGCHFSIRTFKHDFSPYRELVLVVSEPDSELVRQYSTYAEDGPHEWDEKACETMIRELRRQALIGDEAGLVSDPRRALHAWYNRRES